MMARRRRTRSERLMRNDSGKRCGEGEADVSAVLRSETGAGCLSKVGGFVDLEDLIGTDVGQLLHYATGPSYLDRRGSGIGPEAKVGAFIAG